MNDDHAASSSDEPVPIAQHDSVIPEDLERLPPAAEGATEPEEAVPKAEPKKRGRPIGSKSKEPGKPRAPRVKKVSIEQPIEPPMEEDATSTADIPRVLPDSRPIPRDAYDDNTRLMLALLHQQTQNRKTRKVAQWKSWFQ